MKVLHIITWYPTSFDPLRGIWIQRHLEALQPHVEQEVLQLPEFEGPWRVREYRSAWWLNNRLLQSEADVFNVHIAYPALVGSRFLPRAVRRKLVITEHWSYYHYHFHVDRKLPRVKRIFGSGIPVIGVSKRLIADIEAFSGHRFPHAIVPNVVDFDAPVTNEGRREILVMGSFWKHPKMPLEAISAVDKWLQANPHWELHVFGYGPMEEDIITAIAASNQRLRIRWLGRLDKPAIESLMLRASAFVHPSEYETFSVVCAEALSAGLPVLYHQGGAVGEVVGADGIQGREPQNWDRPDGGLDAITQRSWNHVEIAQRARRRFAPDIVGMKYLQALESWFR